jgi:methylglyoxal synthase
VIYSSSIISRASTATLVCYAQPSSNCAHAQNQDSLVRYIEIRKVPMSINADCYAQGNVVAKKSLDQVTPRSRRS